MSWPLSFIPATWRRNQSPACPMCGRGPAPASHKDCSNREADRAGKTDLYIDLASGELHCIACGHTSSLVGWKNYCNCGAVFEGGEIWQGMEAEMGQAVEFDRDHFTQATWFKAAAKQLGTLNWRTIGFARCYWCGAGPDDGSDYFPSYGAPCGAICRHCRDTAAAHLKSWLWRLAGKGRLCSLCHGERRRPVVPLHGGYIDKVCLEVLSWTEWPGEFTKPQY